MDAGAHTSVDRVRRGTIPALLALAFWFLVTDDPPVLAQTADFDARCATPGVVRCFSFDSQAETSPYLASGVTTPAVDTAIKASGTGSLKMTIPSNSGANTSGAFAMNFTPGSLNASNTDPYPVQFGAGEEFYVQWRQRFSPEFLSTFYENGGGWKQAIIGEGDRPGVPAFSCTQLEIVTQNTVQLGIPQMYHSCGTKDGHYEGLEVVSGSTIRLQNGPGLDCTYPGPYTEPRCYRYKANQWMTFQVRVKIGTWYQNNGAYKRDSAIQLWVAEEGQPSRLVLDRDPAKGTGYDIVNLTPGVSKYGKVWLLPYHTNKDPGQVHATAYTWYDDLIVSRAPIPDPVGTIPGPGPDPGGSGAIEAFVTRFYSDALGRAPDPAGLAAWTSWLAANCNATGLDAIARGFFDSEEFRMALPHSLDGLVRKLYVVFLGREPDPAGQAAWAGLVRQARLTVALRGFVPSQEFQAVLPDRTDRAGVTALVSRFYREILQREPDPAGLAGWVDYIVTRDVEGAALGFLMSPEFEARALTARDYVTILYRVFLGRAPDGAGLDAWEMALRDNLMVIINQGFVPSPEFQGLLPTLCSS